MVNLGERDFKTVRRWTERARRAPRRSAPPPDRPPRRPAPPPGSAATAPAPERCRARRPRPQRRRRRHVDDAPKPDPAVRRGAHRAMFPRGIDGRRGAAPPAQMRGAHRAISNSGWQVALAAPGAVAVLEQDRPIRRHEHRAEGLVARLQPLRRQLHASPQIPHILVVKHSDFPRTASTARASGTRSTTSRTSSPPRTSSPSASSSPPSCPTASPGERGGKLLLPSPRRQDIRVLAAHRPRLRTTRRKASTGTPGRMGG